MFDYAGYLKDERKMPDSAVHIFDELTERYNAETKIGGTALLEASTILLSLSKNSAAISHLEKLAKAQEGYELAAEARLKLAKLYKAEGLVKKALIEFDRAREDNDTRIDQLGRSYIGSAECHIALGDKKTARQILAELLITRGMNKVYRQDAKSLLESIAPKKKKKR